MMCLFDDTLYSGCQYLIREMQIETTLRFHLFWDLSKIPNYLYEGYGKRMKQETETNLVMHDRGLGGQCLMMGKDKDTPI